MRTISVTASKAESRSALEWAREYAQFGGAERHELVVVGGQEATRTVVHGNAVHYVVRANERVYLLWIPLGGSLGGPALDAIAQTFQATSTLPVPTPTAASKTVPQSAGAAAARIATALERGDPGLIATVVTPHCWLETWSAASGPIGRAVEPYVAQLRLRFESGLRVSVDRAIQIAPRPGSSGLRLFVRSSWTESGRTTHANLYLRDIDGQWYWGGVEIVPPPP